MPFGKYAVVSRPRTFPEEKKPMPPVAMSDVAPGLVVHLDTTILRAYGGSFTNADPNGGLDRAVQGPHYFLVLDVASGVALAVPLFSKATPGSERLDDTAKAGLPAKWIGETSYFSRYQHWKIPVAALVAASGDEESTAATRRTYGVGRANILPAIAAWQGKNRCGYRVP
jgi:hypothetical protein